MKKNSIYLFLILLLHFSCATDSYYKIRVEIPTYSPFRLADYQEIVIVPFLLQKEVKGFDLNRELSDYWASELAKKYQGKISAKSIPLQKEDDLKNADFWKSLSLNSPKTLFLAGKADFSQEARKAILEKEGFWEDNPLSAQKALSERLVFTLDVNLFLISGETGKPLYEKSLKETRTYSNTKQSPAFAFYELIQQVKLKSFRAILGEERTEERYLLFR